MWLWFPQGARRLEPALSRFDSLGSSSRSNGWPRPRFRLRARYRNGEVNRFTHTAPAATPSTPAGLAEPPAISLQPLVGRRLR